MLLASLTTTCLLACASIIHARKKDDAILLSKVKSLTFRDGAPTSHRRVKAIPQLSCVGGNGKGLYSVDVMRCHNSGSEYDAEDISWTCKADLPPEFKLGSTDVICEGYDSAEDPYVLKGSCGVEYRLVLTPLGEQTYRDHIKQSSWSLFGKNFDNQRNDNSRSDGLAALLFWIIFAVIVLVILYSIFFPSGNDTGGGAGRRRNWGGGGGGGGGGYDDGPPPPYTPRAPPKPKTQRQTDYNASSNWRPRNDSWQPGFWTGTAAGAAAGYAAGSYGNRQQNRDYAGAGPSNWFGGTNNPSGGGYAGPSSYGGPSSGSPSSSRHQSTGFGGTRRR